MDTDADGTNGIERAGLNMAEHLGTTAVECGTNIPDGHGFTQHEHQGWTLPNAAGH